MNGTFVVEQGSIADVLAIVLGQKSEVPHWARPQGLLRYLDAPLAAVQSAPRARGATSRIITISTAGSIRCSSTPTGNTAAPISRTPSSRSTTPNSPRSATSPPSCCSAATAAIETARARHRLRLGRARPLSRRDRRRRRHRHHAVAGAARHRQRARRGKGPGRARPLPPAGLSRRRRAVRPHRLGRHVRACRRQPLRHLLPQERATARRRRRDAAAFDRPLGGPERHQSLDREIHLPRRLYPVAVGGAAGDRDGPACWSPTSKSCACITPRR